MKAKLGKVYLVGAGPGDPSLLTLKGLWCLQEAEVVVYDRLASEYLLALGREDAELIYAGKASHRHTLSQAAINRLLVERAQAGKVVCRLKGGDPFVFGRGGEEAEALAAAGIPFEVVPGVTAAVAAPAYAGIPVTHRGFAQALMVATGHRCREAGEAAPELTTPPSTGWTVVFLMGFENLPAIVSRLLAGGWSGSTPVALVHWGTRAEQRTVTATLEGIEAAGREAGLEPPCLLIVGRVVELRRQLAWRERLPLFGRRVLITRAPGLVPDFARRLLELGGEPVCLPTITLAPPESYAPLDRVLERIEEYDWVIFTSARGVESFLQRLREQGRDIRSLRGEIAALGPATAAAVARYGLRVACLPGEYRAEALLEELAQRISPGARVLLPRAAEAREVLPEGLRSRGIRVEVVPAYRTVPAGARYLPAVRELLAEGRVHFITFTSSSTVRNFVSLFSPGELAPLLERSRVACIGPVTAATARELGVRVDLVATEYTINGLLDCLVQAAREVEPA